MARPSNYTTVKSITKNHCSVEELICNNYSNLSRLFASLGYFFFPTLATFESAHNKGIRDLTEHCGWNFQILSENTWLFHFHSKYRNVASLKFGFSEKATKFEKNLCCTFDKSVVFCARNSALVKKLTKIFQNKCGQVVLYKLYILICFLERYHNRFVCWKKTSAKEN